MPFIHDIGLNAGECSWEQNWYPKTRSFIVRDNHSMCSVSLDFSKKDVHTLPPSDQSFLFCLTIPLGMRCKAELLYYKGEPWKVRLTEVDEEEGAWVKARAHRKASSQTMSPQQSDQQDNSTHQESAH